MLQSLTQFGRGVAALIMARIVNKILNGLGKTERRSCHDVGGLLLERMLDPQLRSLQDASSSDNPLTLEDKQSITSSVDLGAYPSRMSSHLAF